MAGFLTNSGLQKLLVATPLQPMTVKYMAFDAGQGTPSQNMTALFNEVYRTEIPNPIKDPNDPKNLVFTGFVPTTVGGWTIYGVGLFDSLGILVAYLQLDEPIVKTAPDSALKMSWEQDFILKLANSGETDLIISDSIRFDHEKLTNRNHPDAHDIASITGLQGALDQKSTDLTNAVNSINTNITEKDDQNVKLSGNQTVAGVKTFSGGIKTPTINNGNSRLELGQDSAVLSAGQNASLVGFELDAANKQILMTGKLVGDGSGLDGATAAKKGVVQLATTAEIRVGTNSEKVVTPSGLHDSIFGLGQTPQNLTTSRAMGTTYTNSTGKLIVVAVTVFGVDAGVKLYMNNAEFITNDVDGGTGSTGMGASIPVPNGATYRAQMIGGTSFLWMELR